MDNSFDVPALLKHTSTLLLIADHCLLYIHTWFKWRNRWAAKYMYMMAMISVTVCLCTFEYESVLFLKHICLQEFVSSSVIGQNIMKDPATCKHRQIFQGHCGEQDSGSLVR